MRVLEELLKESSDIHGHRCAGQVLGVRMAMAGCREVDIDEPKGCKKLVVYVETDRCATDALQAVTGCSLGKRTLKFLDYGKMAATFVNLESRKAVRIVARDDARLLASSYCPDISNPREAQKTAYARMPDDALFSIQPKAISIPQENLPGFRGPRVYCAECGERVDFRREIVIAGRALCVPCARGSYLPGSANSPSSRRLPKIILVVGYKKTGKTSLIEKLVPELSARGYRVGTVKHHHSDFPVAADGPGTDSWRHRRAGARTAVLLTPTEVAFFRGVGNGDSLQRILRSMRGNDVIIVEGCHEEPLAKIEMVSDRTSRRLCAADENLLAVVGAAAGEPGVPSFAPDDIAALADLIESRALPQISAV